jgi:hypothetical protein
VKYQKRGDGTKRAAKTVDDLADWFGDYTLADDEGGDDEEE